MDIICSRGKSPQDEFPNFILVEFPKFKGPPFIEDHPTWIHTGSIATRICDNHSHNFLLQGTMH